MTLKILESELAEAKENVDISRLTFPQILVLCRKALGLFQFRAA